MDIGILFDAISKRGIDFFTGVPDSLLSVFCDEIVNRYGNFSKNHVVAHNEGGAVALACGHYMATGKVSCVYMQNSGIGNALNPVASLAHPKVYGIAMLFVIGWRGEPGIHDEPQHVFQGEATLKLLSDMEIDYCVIDKDTSLQQLENTLDRFKMLFADGKSAAFIVRKGAFTGNGHHYMNNYQYSREQAIGIVLEATGSDPVVSTTGKISRELFEIRKQRSAGHEKDFLTVGSMGHCVMIALGISMEQPERRVWCLDGDGSVLMHMGALGVVGYLSPKNFVHVVLNNAAHETVGGMPTVAGELDIPSIALACGYSHVHLSTDEQSLKDALGQTKNQNGPILIEVRVALGSRSDLGRPTIPTQENKDAFMRFLSE